MRYFKPIVWLLSCAFLVDIPQAQAAADDDLFARDNLVAWCIVPFDAKNRGPEERAAMLQRLGFKHFAYDWRAEHVPSFDAEVEALKRHGVELTAWWFPTTLDADARRILGVLRRHQLKTQLWVMGGGGPVASPQEQRQRVLAEAKRIRPIAEEAARLGCAVGLYNHGGWFGEPENQIAIIQELKLPNVGIVYNLHHGHEHLERLPQLLEKMAPHLYALNVNGMVKDGDKLGKKILPLGLGDLDYKVLKAIRDSGYRGRIGILGHTQDDAEARLQDNLDGLAWLRTRLAGKDPGPRPRYRTVPESKPPQQSDKGDHWGVDAVGFRWTENDSRDERWKDMDIGRWLASALPLPGAGTVTKALSIRIGWRREAAVCFDTENLKMRAAWAGGFLHFTPARYGLIAPPQIDGTAYFTAGGGPGWPGARGQYKGMYCHGDRLVLAYTIDGAEVLESPWLERADDQPIFTRSFDIAASAQALTMVLVDKAKVELRRIDGIDVAVMPSTKGLVAIAVGPQATARITAPAGASVQLEVPASSAAVRFKLMLWAGPPAQVANFAAAVRDSAAPEDMRALIRPGPLRWTASITTQGVRAPDDAPYVVDTLTLPFDNPYRALFFAGGHDFFANGDIALCTVHGDVWRVSGVDASLGRLTWKRYATGLFQPLGLKVVGERVHVLGRDQITRLHDSDGDGEADYYENFCNLGRTSAGSHDYTTCLETDAVGNFYFLTAQEGLVRVSADGKQRSVVASGFRNPNGLGIGPGDVVTVAPQEGEWTPASHIALVRPGSYGSPDYKVSDPRQEGHDPVQVASATLLEDGRTVFLEVPDLRPVMQLAIRFALRAADGARLRQTIHYTINELGRRHMEASRLTRPKAAGSLSPAEEAQLLPGLMARFAQAGAHDVRTTRLAALFVLRGESPTPFLTPGRFRVTFDGFIRGPLRGEYEFSLRGRGQASLRIGGKEVLRVSALAANVIGRVTLHKGVNALALEYTPPAGADAGVRLFWQGDDFAAEPVPPTALAHRPDEELRSAQELRRGRDVFETRHCGRCHAVPGAPTEPAQAPPDLIGIGDRLHPLWVRQWLLDPKGLNRQATMPALLPPSDPTRLQKAADLVAYVAARKAARKATSAAPAGAAHGERLYEELHCIGCHRFTPPGSADAYGRHSLFHVGAKFQPGWLSSYLDSPQAHHAGSRMPRFRGIDTASLESYLRRQAKGTLPAPLEQSEGDARRGRDLFTSLRCVNCHPLGSDHGPSALPLQFGMKTRTTGCLSSGDRGASPQLGLDDAERRAVSRFLATDGRALRQRVAAEEAERLIGVLNCVACHQRDAALSPRTEILGEEGSGLVPEPLPALTWTGEKLCADWLERFLDGRFQHRLRPTLHARMPEFPAHARTLARGLAAQHGIDPAEPSAAVDPQRAAVGELLTRPTALDCRQCHAIADQRLVGDARTQIAVGIPFRHVRQRLREEFYRRFVLDPPRYDPQSKMPKLLGDGRTTKATAIYDGDARRQIDAI